MAMCVYSGMYGVRFYPDAPPEISNDFLTIMKTQGIIIIITDNIERPVIAIYSTEDGVFYETYSDISETLEKIMDYYGENVYGLIAEQLRKNCG